MKVTIQVRDKNDILYEIEINTTTVSTHALMDDYPEVWKVIVDNVGSSLRGIVKILDNNK